MLIKIMQKKMFSFLCSVADFCKTFTINNEEHFFLAWILFPVVHGKIILRITYICFIIKSVTISLDAKLSMLYELC